jgi:hypothetical protein
MAPPRVPELPVKVQPSIVTELAPLREIAPPSDDPFTSDVLELNVQLDSAREPPVASIAPPSIKLAELLLNVHPTSVIVDDEALEWAIAPPLRATLPEKVQLVRTGAEEFVFWIAAPWSLLTLFENVQLVRCGLELLFLIAVPDVATDEVPLALKVQFWIVGLAKRNDIPIKPLVIVSPSNTGPLSLSIVIRIFVLSVVVPMTPRSPDKMLTFEVMSRASGSVAP